MSSNINAESEDLFAKEDDSVSVQSEQMRDVSRRGARGDDDSESIDDVSVRSEDKMRDNTEVDDEDSGELSAAAALTSLVSAPVVVNPGAAAIEEKEENEQDDDDKDDDEDEDEDVPEGKELHIPQRYTKSGRKRAVSFPLKLMKVLSNKKNWDVIAWTASGTAFEIRKPKLFVADILPTHFKSAKYSSFTRKLHRWGFMRHYRGDEAGAFYHKMFLKDRLDLVEQMTCHKDMPPAPGGAATAPHPVIKTAAATAATVQRKVIAANKLPSTPIPAPPAATARRPLMNSTSPDISRMRISGTPPTSADASRVRRVVQVPLAKAPTMPQRTEQVSQQQQRRPMQQPIIRAAAVPPPVQRPPMPHMLHRAAAHPLMQTQRPVSVPQPTAVDLNAAIEMEVNRRLKERINNAAMSRQALVLQQLERERQQELERQQQQQQAQQAAQLKVNSLLEQRIIALAQQQQRLQAAGLRGLPQVDLSSVYRKFKPSTAAPNVTFGGQGSLLSLPPTNIQGAKTA